MAHLSPPHQSMRTPATAAPGGGHHSHHAPAALYGLVSTLLIPFTLGAAHGSNWLINPSIPQAEGGLSEQSSTRESTPHIFVHLSICTLILDFRHPYWLGHSPDFTYFAAFRSALLFKDFIIPPRPAPRKAEGVRG